MAAASARAAGAQGACPLSFSSPGEVPEALVFSGGGARGACAVGALAALHALFGWDFGARQPAVKHVAGTSIGALIGYLIVLGYTVEELKTLIRTAPFGTMLRSHILLLLSKVQAMNTGRALRAWLESCLQAKLQRKDMTLAELQSATGMTLTVVAVDAQQGGAARYLNAYTAARMSVIDAVTASAALPLVFPAVKWADMELLDGGLADHYPIGIFPEGTALGFHLIDNNLQTLGTGRLARISQSFDMYTRSKVWMQWLLLRPGHRRNTVTLQTTELEDMLRPLAQPEAAAAASALNVAAVDTYYHQGYTQTMRQLQSAESTLDVCGPAWPLTYAAGQRSLPAWAANYVDACWCAPTGLPHPAPLPEPAPAAERRPLHSDS